MIETDAQTARHEHFSLSGEASILGPLFFCTNILNTFCDLAEAFLLCAGTKTINFSAMRRASVSLAYLT